MTDFGFAIYLTQRAAGNEPVEIQLSGPSKDFSRVYPELAKGRNDNSFAVRLLVLIMLDSRTTGWSIVRHERTHRSRFNGHDLGKRKASSGSGKD
jgi:hypothetical protein